jgi:hypothetical protein
MKKLLDALAEMLDRLFPRPEPERVPVRVKAARRR